MHGLAKGHSTMTSSVGLLGPALEFALSLAHVGCGGPWETHPGWTVGGVDRCHCTVHCWAMLFCLPSPRALEHGGPVSLRKQAHQPLWLTSERIEGPASVPHLPVMGSGNGARAQYPLEGTSTFSASLWVGPCGPSRAEKTLPALSACFCSIGPRAELSPITGSTSRQAAQPRHLTIGARGAGLPGEP